MRLSKIVPFPLIFSFHYECYFSDFLVTVWTKVIKNKNKIALYYYR